jgi:UDP-glucuronate decarboxylase
MRASPSFMNQIIQQDVAAIVEAPLPWQEFSGATVLVTGAVGFLPAYMVETLLFLNQTVLARPARIVASVRNAERARERFSFYRDRTDLEFLIQDVSDPLNFTDPIDYLIHAASHASPRYYKTDPVGTLSANTLGTYNLLSAAQKLKARGFLFFSSGEIYGTVGNPNIPVAEHDGGSLDPLDVRACYGESKRMGETMCVAWEQQFGLATRIVRPFHTYGPGMQLDDGRVFADFVRDILRGGPIVLKSDGKARRSFCYLADATRGFFTVLLKGAAGEAYNVANPDGECSIAELAARLANLYREQGITVEQHLRTDPYYLASPIVSTLANVDKLKALGWRSTWEIEEGFRRTVDSYRSNSAGALAG